jgi:hypothetical protein
MATTLTSTGITFPDATTQTTAAASPIPAGTVMLFVQTAAPTGWTKSTTHNNKALRVVSGTASSGGTVAFTTAFASKSVSGTVNNTTLTTSQMPSHTHSQYRIASLSGGGYGYQAWCNGPFTWPNGAATALSSTQATGGGTAHNHSFSGTAINLAVQYVDVIIASKD